MMVGHIHTSVPILTDALIACRSSREVPVYIDTKFSVSIHVDQNKITSVEKRNGQYCPVKSDGTLLHNIDLSVLREREKVSSDNQVINLPLHSGTAWITIKDGADSSASSRTLEDILNSIAAIVNGKARDEKGLPVDTINFDILFSPNVEEAEFKGQK